MTTKEKRLSKIALISFVLSLLFFIPLGSVAAIILGIIALSNINKNKNQHGRGFAIAGIIIGSIVTLLYILVMIWIIYLALLPY